MKDLPSVSAFKIEKALKNSQERYYGSSKELPKNDKVSIVSKINAIFSSSNHVYKSRVRIILKDDTLERTIIGKTNTELLTITGDKIAIKDILDIERI